jgi:hypothetical protein
LRDFKIQDPLDVSSLEGRTRRQHADKNFKPFSSFNRSILAVSRGDQ